MQVDALKSASRQLIVYRDTFLAIVDIQKRIGLNTQDALYGELRASVHLTESLLQEEHEYRLTSNMLTLRRNEKNFMLRSDLKYLNKFNDNYSIFEQHLQASKLSVSLQEELIKAMKI